MDGIVKELSGISVDGLRTRLQNYGEEVGPITNTTKSLFIKKLARKIFADRFPDRVKTERNEEAPDQSSSDKIKSNTDSALKTPTHDVFSTTAAQAFYGICLPAELLNDRSFKDAQLVFTDRVAALKAIKSYKGSRFKAFKSLDEAEQFSKANVEQICSPLKPSVSESAPSAEAIAFKAPKMPELVSLRRMIEKGDEENFKETVWNNPRYLISSGDTPVILQEGFRYNALHVAAKSNQAQMCRLILDTIQDSTFIKTLYPMDSDVTGNNRIKFITDLYLNMPDKGFCESPLHFACKFGFADVVEVFASHPHTDRKLVNKHGETPSQVVCSRCSSVNKDVADRIQGLLEDSCFVPLLRSEDNCSQPVIGEPWSPDAAQSNTLVPAVPAASPRDTQLVVRAYAGPMSPSMAGTFHQRWITPPSGSPNHVKRRLSEIRREDCDKGIERIGRKLAHDLKVPWAEYWQFLKAYVDLRSSHGLSLLNNHLRSQYLELFSEECSIHDGRLLEKNIKNSSMSEYDVDSPNILDCSDDAVFSRYALPNESDGQTRLDLRYKYLEDVIRRRGSRSSSSSSGSSESNYTSCMSGSESESEDEVFHNTSDILMVTEPDKEIQVATDIPVKLEAASWSDSPAQIVHMPGSSRGDCGSPENLETVTVPDAFTKYRNGTSSNTDIETSPFLSLDRVSSSETSSDVRLPCASYARTQNSEKTPLSPSSVETLVSSLAEDIESKLTISRALNEADSMEKGSFARIAAKHGTGWESSFPGHKLKETNSWGYVKNFPAEGGPEKMITDADERGILKQSKFAYIPGVSQVSNSPGISQVSQLPNSFTATSEGCQKQGSIAMHGSLCNDSSTPETLVKGSSTSHERQQGSTEHRSQIQCSSSSSSHGSQIQTLSTQHGSQQGSSTSQSQYLGSSTSSASHGSECPTVPTSSFSGHLPGTPKTPQQNQRYYTSRTPQQRWLPAVFINGSEASKLDVDVYRAIEDVPIERREHPYIYRWKKLVTSFDEVTRQSWPTPARSRSRTSTADSSQLTSSPALKHYRHLHSPQASPVTSLSSGHTHQRLPPPRFDLLS